MYKNHVNDNDNGHACVASSGAGADGCCFACNAQHNATSEKTRHTAIQTQRNDNTDLKGGGGFRFPRSDFVSAQRMRLCTKHETRNNEEKPIDTTTQQPNKHKNTNAPVPADVAAAVGCVGVAALSISTDTAAVCACSLCFDRCFYIPNQQ